MARSGFEPEVAVAIPLKVVSRLHPSTSDRRAFQTTARASEPRENWANWRVLGGLTRSPVVVRRKKGPVAGGFSRSTRQLLPRADWLAEKRGVRPPADV